MVAYGARAVVGVAVAVYMRVGAASLGGAVLGGAFVVIVAICRLAEATRSFGADPWMA